MSVKSPYLEVVDRRLDMEGGAKETVSGVLGHTHGTPMRSLGGLVHNTKASAPVPKANVMSEKKAETKGLQTDRHILGHAPKTHIPGAHYAQIPYPGHFMSELGKRV